ncbi:MAG: DUF1704 domain-containing protein [Polyangiaceae bacterium]|nr:DUF1704 domain-containing protein [Polyangiaceae bacterium]
MPPSAFAYSSASAATAPAFTAAAGAALAKAASRIRMIAVTTPQNLRAELARLESTWAVERGGNARFVYDAPRDYADLIDALSRGAEALNGQGPLGAIYAARARELVEEARVCASAGTPLLWEAARRRYRRRDAFDARADELAREWLAEAVDKSEYSCILSDDDRNPGSLVSAMRRAIGERRLPLRVLITSDLAPLAATGDGFIQVAAGRAVSPRDVERTVLHEIEGHAGPAAKAKALPLSIFAVGTAWGADDQEGRALALERRNGFLDAGRRRELALRHVAARAVEERADFPDVSRMLVDLGANIPAALRIAARVCRGGGLAREAVYLPALLRVEAAIEAEPDIDHVLASGRVAVPSASILGAWAGIDALD